MNGRLGAALVVLAVCACACAGDESPGSTDSTSAPSAVTVPVGPASTSATSAAASNPTAPTIPTGPSGPSESGTSGSVATGRRPDGFTTVTLELTGADTCCVWLADEPAERSRGLMRVTDLGEPVGMLFAYPQEQMASFFMFNTVMPLSIAFFDGRGRFVSSTEMEPCRSSDPAACPRYGSEGPYRYALEVPQGEWGTLGIGPGTTITPGEESDRCST